MLVDRGLDLAGDTIVHGQVDHDYSCAVFGEKFCGCVPDPS
jgi:hypothetical protein